MSNMDTRTYIKMGIVLVLTTLLIVFNHIDIMITGQSEPAGYFTIADVGVYFAASLFGGAWGAIIAAVACALGDIFVGHAIYAPATIVIKAVMVFLTVHYLKKGTSWAQIAKAVFVAGGAMVLLYFIYDLIILDNYMNAALALPINLLQVVASSIFAIPVLKICAGRSYKKESAADPFAEATQNSSKRNLK